MDNLSQLILFFLILFPFFLAIFLLVIKRWKADTTGILVWFLISILAIVLETPLNSVFVISIAGIIDSFKITLMVGSSILMITYMAESGALARIITFIKTMKGTEPAWQILFLNFGLGCFFVTIGATPVSILPPIMLALGYPPVIAVALPAIGYDPLTTYALLAIPAVVFTGQMESIAKSGLLLNSAPTLQEVGQAFSLYMPVISTGIAISMLYIAGGWKMLQKKTSIIIALISGITAGISAVIANYLGMVTVTGIISGLGVLLLLGLYAKIQGNSIIDCSNLTQEDLEIEKNMSLIKACSPWIFLVTFTIITNLIPPIFQLLFNKLLFPIKIGEFTINTRFLWQAYTWVIISLLISLFILPSDRKVLKNTLIAFKSRGFRPMVSTAIFFAIAYILNYSAPNNSSLNMVAILADFTASNFGIVFPLLVPLIGFFGGFVSGSETSSIVMFSRYHVQTSNKLNLDPMTTGTANGIGGGLASVIAPAKVQNAAATIDSIGIEGQVIRKTFGIALAMIMVLSAISLIWAKSFPVLDTIGLVLISSIYIVSMALLFIIGKFLSKIR